MLINFCGSIRSSNFICIKCVIHMLNFRGWSQPRNYFNSEIFRSTVGTSTGKLTHVCHHIWKNRRPQCSFSTCLWFNQSSYLHLAGHTSSYSVGGPLTPTGSPPLGIGPLQHQPYILRGLRDQPTLTKAAGHAGSQVGVA